MEIDINYNSQITEMSRYISIEQYDDYEKDHPFYKDMALKMIDSFGEWRKSQLLNGSRKSNHIWEVLELGAGTGLFTEYISAQDNVNVTAIEIDQVCFDYLQRKLSSRNNTKCLNVDSCAFTKDSANEDKYDFVFSSFADHHIQDLDKLSYLVGVSKVLLTDGLFIVGEEFLPNYSDTEDNSRATSIRIYHEYIIELIQRINDADKRSALSHLERQAMLSGLQGVGDFKVSAGIYSSLLNEAGMSCAITKIGPSDRDNVGGVYVVVSSAL